MVPGQVDVDNAGKLGRIVLLTQSEHTGGVDQHGQRVEVRGKSGDCGGVGDVQPRHALRGCAVDPDGPIAGLPECGNKRAADPACGTGDESGGSARVH